jgi:hypothetical protein
MWMLYRVCRRSEFVADGLLLDSWLLDRFSRIFCIYFY